jgi:uncharacterized spore protein YtfJ
VSGLVAGGAVRAGGRVLVPVARVWLHAEARWAAGGREPVAVVVVEADGPRALDLNGAEIPLAPLLEQAEGLAAALEGHGADGP